MKRSQFPRLTRLTARLVIATKMFTAPQLTHLTITGTIAPVSRLASWLRRKPLPRLCQLSLRATSKRASTTLAPEACVATWTAVLNAHPQLASVELGNVGTIEAALIVLAASRNVRQLTLAWPDATERDFRRGERLFKNASDRKALDMFTMKHGPFEDERVVGMCRT
jgi:hypothetical protein